MTEPAAVRLPRERVAAGSRWRLAIQVAGELMVTAGAILVLFVVWQLFGTGLQTARAQHTLRSELQQQWSVTARPAVVPGVAVGPVITVGGVRVTKPTHSVKVAPVVEKPPADGKPLGLLTIPRLSGSWVVVQGVSLDDLALGPGHYPATAMPGQIGNFAVAGHRATHDQPFAYLDQVRVDDRLIVTTATRVYVYRVTQTFLTQPTDISVLAPVPNEPGAKATQARITLTTCNPRWGHTQRLIVYGVLAQTLARA